MKDLNEFLDEEYREEAEGYSIKSESEADKALGKIKSIKKEMEENILMVQDKKERIDQWLEKVNGNLEGMLNHYQSHLAAYALKKREADPSFKSKKLPNGTYRFKKQQPKYEYKNDVVIKSLRELGYTELVKVDISENPIKAEIKKKFKLNNGRLYDVETGEAIEGITVEDQPDKFEIIPEV